MGCPGDETDYTMILGPLPRGQTVRQRDTTHQYPILMTRTPYGIGPYGGDAYRGSLGPSQQYMDEGMIFVYHDARTELEGVLDDSAQGCEEAAKHVDRKTDSYDATRRDHDRRIGESRHCCRVIFRSMAARRGANTCRNR